MPQEGQKGALETEQGTPSIAAKTKKETEEAGIKPTQEGSVEKPELPGATPQAGPIILPPKSPKSTAEYIGSAGAKLSSSGDQKIIDVLQKSIDRIKALLAIDPVAFDDEKLNAHKNDIHNALVDAFDALTLSKATVDQVDQLKVDTSQALDIQEFEELGTRVKEVRRVADKTLHDLERRLAIFKK